MNLKPIYDKLLVKPLDSESVTKTGIFIPDTSTEKPYRAEVLRAGQGRLTENGQLVPLVVKEGDTVIYGKHSGQLVRVDGRDLVLLKEDDVVAIIEYEESTEKKD